MINKKLIEYRKRAEMKRTIKNISFNNKTDKDLLTFAQSVDFSQWVKDKIRDELNK